MPEVLEREDSFDDMIFTEQEYHWQQSEIKTNANAVIKQQSHQRKEALRKLKLALGLGITTSKVALGVPGVVGLATGATVATGGLGLLIAGGASTLAGSVQNTVASVKSIRHLNALKDIQAQAQSYSCKSSLGNSSSDDGKKLNGHRFLFEQLLPYTIGQKRKKAIRRGVGAVPLVGGAVEFARSKTKGIGKWIKGTRGTERTYMAEQLASHHIHNECSLASAIIAELLGICDEDAALCRGLELEELGVVLCRKLRST